MVDGHARPLSLIVTAGQRADVTQLDTVLAAICIPRPGRGRPRKRPTCLRVDRVYGACQSRRGKKGASPPRFDVQAYKGRNVVERAIDRLKHFRAVATCYEKRGHDFFAAVTVATII